MWSAICLSCFFLEASHELLSACEPFLYRLLRDRERRGIDHDGYVRNVAGIEGITSYSKWIGDVIHDAFEIQETYVVAMLGRFRAGELFLELIA